MNETYAHLLPRFGTKRGFSVPSNGVAAPRGFLLVANVVSKNTQASQVPPAVNTRRLRNRQLFCNRNSYKQGRSPANTFFILFFIPIYFGMV
ncbi:hypothetical protein [Dyadobacter sp. 676]|uniref:Transmembrane protein n=1 Tax=Dyadobacter sp. 676 TaxID=3088362 RepID=A0AAU8FNV6_9BACT